MSLLPGWRAALRIARRDALRAKGRSALVVAMIALPVLGVTAADVTYRSTTPTKAEQLTAQMGSADAVFSSARIGPVPVEQLPNATNWGTPGHRMAETDGDTSLPVDVPGTIPKGSRYVTEQSAPATVTTRHGIVTTEIVELRTSDQVVRGKLELTGGSYPSGKGEMVATDRFLESTGLHIGSRTTLRGPEQSYTITGSVELPDDLAKHALYAEPGAVLAPWKAASDRDEKVVPPNPDAMHWLVQGPAGAGISWPDVLAANEKGVLVLSRQAVLDPPPDSEIPRAATAGDSFEPGQLELSAAMVTVIVMAVLEIVLLAGPAFAVGARRSRRQLGLIGSCGGDRRQVRAVVLAGGVVLGGAGAVTGVVAGVGLTAAFRPLIEGWEEHRFGRLELRWAELLTIGAVGLVTGVLAALAPAIAAGRRPVLESLTGRRGTRRSSRVLPMVGGAALASGVAVAVLGGLTTDTTLVAGGSVVAELGLLGCVPVIVGFIGRFGARLPLSPRLALRDAARNRGRTAPAVAAVMAAVAGTVALATYTVSMTAQHAYDRVPAMTPGTVALLATDPAGVDQLPLARAAAEQTLPVTGAHAGLGRVWAGSDCSVYHEDESGCGTLTLVKPKGEGHSCPLRGPGARELAESLSAAAHKDLMNSPACTDENGTVTAFDSGASKIVVGDAALLTSYVKLDDPAAAKALAAGTPVLLNSAYAKNGQVTLKAVHTYDDRDKENRKPHPGKAEITTERLKVYVAPAEYSTTPGIRMILPEKTADRLGLHTAPYGSLYSVTHPPTDAEQQAMSSALAQAGNGVHLQAAYEYADEEDVTLLILALFAGVVTLGAAAITTGLAKADSEADLATLGAVGAPPRLRRTLSGFQCGVVALTGVLLGTVAGVVPAVALRLVDLSNSMDLMRAQPMYSAYTPIILPWETIGLLVVAVPVLAGLLAAAFSRSRPDMTRRAG